MIAAFSDVLHCIVLHCTNMNTDFIHFRKWYIVRII